MMLNWKDVLNPNHGWHGNLESFLNNVVFPSGYPYFVWNGRIYKVGANRSIEETDMVQEEIEGGQ